MTNQFYKGDIIRTNPQDNFWGIAVVLSESEKTSEFHALCHIAITPLVYQHKVEFEELDIAKLSVLQFTRGIRLTPGEGASRSETSIGVYLRKFKTPVDIIGNVNPDFIYSGQLPFSPDFGLEVSWPLYGAVARSLGMEALITWRRIYDSENFQKEIEESKRKHEALMLKIKEEEREKRKNSKLRKPSKPT